MSARRYSNRYNEILFVSGTLFGLLVLTAGIAFLILGLSVGVREVEFFHTWQSRTGAILGGLVVAAVGIGLRNARHGRPAGSARQALRHGGSVVAIVGLASVLVAISAEQTNSAPFLTSMSQKVLLMLMALVFIAVGSVIVRLAGRRIGW